MCQFYSIVQGATKTLPQFVIRFQNLQKQLTRSPTPEELTETFLTALRETLPMTLAVVDLTGKGIEDIIRRFLLLDSAQSMSMNIRQRVLQTEEDTRFHQAIQCSTCVNLNHSSLECTLRCHCPIYHSRAHTLELCEYNLLNRNRTPVRHIEPQPTPTQSKDRLRYLDNDRPRYNDQSRYTEYRDWEMITAVKMTIGTTTTINMEITIAEMIIIGMETTTIETQSTIGTRTTEGMTQTRVVDMTTGAPPTIGAAKQSHDNTTTDPNTFGNGRNGRTTIEGDHPTTIVVTIAADRETRAKTSHGPRRKMNGS